MYYRIGCSNKISYVEILLYLFVNHSSLSLDVGELKDALFYALAYLSSRTRSDCTPVKQTKNCDVSVDCETGSWGPWSQCTNRPVPTKTRKKATIRTEIYGGHPCCSNRNVPGCIEDTETEDCPIPEGKLLKSAVNI